MNNNKNLSFPKFVVGNLPLSRSLLKEEQQPNLMKKVEDPRQKPSGMTTDFMGFTLIELLVVVLIIGILAAVALPQYQKAVERSKATQALTLLKSLGQAYEAHHLASGEWATTFDELAVDLTSWTGTTKFLDYSDSAITDTKSNGEWSLQIENIGQGGSTAQDIRIHRLTGKYKGAGFVIYFDNSSHTAKKQIVCNERITACREEYCFNLSAGDYCEKIIKGTLSSEASTSRSYTLP